MKTYQRYHYKRAPLQEAIFEARFSVESPDVTLPGQFFEKIRKKFPKKNDLNILTFTFGTTPSNIKDAPQIQVPVMQAWNEERTNCLQMGPGIVTANNKNYIHWEDFTQSVQLLLNSYFECTVPLETKKVGFRCINRFLIPEDNVVLTDYFRIGLTLPDTLLSSRAFEITLVKEVSHDGSDITTRIKFISDTLKPSETGIAFILDIESFVTQNINTNPKDILKTASSCHEYLKEVFESTLQSKLRNLLEGVKQ